MKIVFPELVASMTVPIEFVDRNVNAIRRVDNFLERKDELYKCLRSYLIFGRAIGIIPLSGLLHKDLHRLALRKCSLGVLVSSVIIVWATINIGVTLFFLFRTEKRNPSDIAWATAPLSFYIIGIYVYSYFLRRASVFINLFDSWNKIPLYFNRDDVYLKRDMNCVAAVIFTSCVFENLVWHLKAFPLFDQSEVVVHQFNISKDASPLEVFYHRGYPYWGKFVPYHPILAALLFAGHKLILYAWNYTDILITLFSRAFSFKFNALVDIGLEKINEANNLNDPTLWKNLVEDHYRLCEVLEQFSEFLSPLIFMGFGVDIFFTGLQLHISLTPAGNNSFGATLYAVWSVVHIGMRVLSMTIYASRVHEGARGLLEVLRHCPTECYSKDVERTERNLQYGNPVGLHGLNCFLITKPLLLSFLSVVTTLEIVLLQSTIIVSP